MKTIKRFLRIILGILLIGGAVFVFAAAREASDSREADILPDYDYVSEIKSLIKEKRYGEAVVLCEDVQNLQLPCASEIPALKAEAETQNKKIWNRILKAGRAFITGNPDGSIEEIGASMASDMFMYGDIRDLVKQGWYKITRQETDPLVAALAGAGLVTEFVDFADWAPAMFKAFKKSGVITRKMADTLLAVFKKIGRTRKLDNSAKAFFANTKTMVDSAGFIRSKNMFKTASKVDDVILLARQSRVDPSLAHLVAKHAGTDAVKVMKNASPGYLKLIARKGRLALRMYKSYHKHKTLWTKIPESVLHTAVGAGIVFGVILAVSGIIPLFWNKRKKRDSANMKAEK